MADHSRDQEWVRVIGPDGYRERPMKRKLAMNPTVREMGISIVGEGGIPILENNPKRGRPSNADKRVKELEERLIAMQAQLEAAQAPKPNTSTKPVANADKA